MKKKKDDYDDNAPLTKEEIEKFGNIVKNYINAVYTDDMIKEIFKEAKTTVIKINKIVK